MDADKVIANVRSDLLRARKQGDDLTARTLLSLLNAIDNAGAVSVPANTTATEVVRRELSVSDVRGIIDTEVAELERALELYRLSNVADMANEMTLQVEILRRLRDLVK